MRPECASRHRAPSRPLAPYRPRRGWLFFLGVTAGVALASAPPSAVAVTITGVTAPDLLLRPSDGMLHNFSVTVTGTYDRTERTREGVPATVKATFFDHNAIQKHTAIHVLSFVTDPPPDSTTTETTPWTANVTFKVGCRTDPEIYGPSGDTGEDKMDQEGYFRFEGPELMNAMWGFNNVECSKAVDNGTPTPLTGQGGSSVYGDLNGDGAINNFDIAPFETALTDPDSFRIEFPAVDPLFVGDVNKDGTFDNFDIAAFESLLTGAGVAGAKVNVPEPSALLAVLGPAALHLARWRRRGTRRC